jgi:hypothetical protein
LLCADYDVLPKFILKSTYIADSGSTEFAVKDDLSRYCAHDLGVGWRGVYKDNFSLIGIALDYELDDRGFESR